jgi:hypothetical protein
MVFKKLQNFKIALFVFSVFIQQSCVSLKPSANKSGKRLYENFYAGTHGTQYFIKPLVFYNEKKGGLDADITFRFKNEMKDSAIVNFSVYGKQLIKSVDSLFINNGKVPIAFTQIDILFFEKSNGGYKTRISTKGALSEIHDLFAERTWLITLYHNGEGIQYKSSAKTTKSIGTLNELIFTMLKS